MGTRKDPLCVSVLAFMSARNTSIWQEITYIQHPPSRIGQSESRIFLTQSEVLLNALRQIFEEMLSKLTFAGSFYPQYEHVRVDCEYAIVLEVAASAASSFVQDRSADGDRATNVLE